jgi:hypothetical protein
MGNMETRDMKGIKGIRDKGFVRIIRGFSSTRDMWGIRKTRDTRVIGILGILGRELN